MPIPKPRSNEEKNDFISRCVSDEKMKQEFPEMKQRVAVCFDAWKSKKTILDDVKESLQKLKEKITKFFYEAY